MTWSPEKNALLKEERGFGFEDVVEAIEGGGLLDDLAHPSARYAGQRLMIVALEGYAIVVPYVEEEEYLFLKTAFASRKATQRYLKEEPR